MQNGSALRRINNLCETLYSFLYNGIISQIMYVVHKQRYDVIPLSGFTLQLF